MRDRCLICKKLLDKDVEHFPYLSEPDDKLDIICWDCFVKRAEKYAKDAERELRKNAMKECESCGRILPAHPRHFPVRHGVTELGLDPVCRYCRTGTPYFKEWAFSAVQAKKRRNKS